MSGSETLDASKLAGLVHRLSGDRSDLDPVAAAARNKTYVLIGEATHGTHEFYRMRAEITKRLVLDHGFCAIAIEGDWPDANRIHRYVTDETNGEAVDALDGFKRFPTWMWRNADVLDFIGWLRSFNDALPPHHRASIYGLDLYSLYDSMQAVLEYLERADPAAAQRARERYSCFDRFGPDTEEYAHSVAAGLTSSCQAEVLEQLIEMQRRSFENANAFYAEQNARVVASAEEYYRTMLDREISSWNVRDRFMFETLERLTTYMERKHRRRAKIVVWAHNSHVGDARATSMGAGRELNIGQLVRQAHYADSLLIGFTTASGTVTAASNWHGDAERKTVRNPLPGSWEALFHDCGVPNFYLDLQHAANLYAPLRGRMLERAIGVVYRPSTELYSHYLEARIADQFDALFHYDRTRAVEPLERTARWEAGEVAETYPTGI
jgi:erythromycin esterase-like protein